MLDSPAAGFLGQWLTLILLNQVYFLLTPLSSARFNGAMWNSSQDGGIGRQALPPHTTTERITTISQNK